MIPITCHWTEDGKKKDGQSFIPTMTDEEAGPEDLLKVI